MNDFTPKKVKHVCPRTCYSGCSMISTVENNRLVYLSGDASHPYTKGKVCAKGLAYFERNYHQDRLKSPHYQEVKGSGKFKQITWEKAFELILSEMVKIQRHCGNFLPLALYKGAGNIGIHHLVTEQFFSSIGKTTRIVGSSSRSAGYEAIQYDVGAVKMSDPALIKTASMIMIWGANPAATNIHLIPFILEAKIKGAKIVVLDPIYTETAEQADLYIQLCPSTDGALANILIKGLLEADAFDREFIEKRSTGFKELKEHVQTINKHDYLKKCGVSEEAIDLLLNWVKDTEIISHIIGFGLQKHANSGQNIRAIEALAAIHGDLGKVGGGIFMGHNDSMIFNNQQLSNSEHLGFNNRIVNMNERRNSNLPSAKLPIEMLWISCANPLTQNPNPQLMSKTLKDIAFVVTVEQFLTPTAEMSNLILPTTTHFEEYDIVTSNWHREISLNDKAVPPYFESRSEWWIMKELAKRLIQYDPVLCSFPIHTSEEDYLNAQFNDKVFELYGIKDLADLRNRRLAFKNPPVIAWRNRLFATETGKYQFSSPEAKENGFSPLPVFVEGKLPNKDHPFWLITPHNPYAHNSQFHFLHLSEEDEAYVGIHPMIAKKLGIFNGEVVSVFNKQACIEIKAVYSNQVPEDILFIYQSWYPESEVTVNQLVSVSQTDMGKQISGIKGIAFHDTFVNIGKL